MYINNNIFNFKNKKLILVLNKIYGINTEQAKYILKNLGINTNISVNDLTQPLLKQINEFLIKKNYIINKDLQYKTNMVQLLCKRQKPCRNTVEQTKGGINNETV